MKNQSGLPVPSQPPSRLRLSVSEIRKLHCDICEAARTSLNKAIRIGEILTEVKSQLKHGEWLPWLTQHLPFSGRTARNYMQCYEQRERLKLANVANLSEAYDLLAEPKNSLRPTWAKASYPKQVVMDALEICDVTEFVQTKKGFPPSQQEMVEIFFILCEAAEGRPRTRTDEQGRFWKITNEGKWQIIDDPKKEFHL